MAIKHDDDCEDPYCIGECVDPRLKDRPSDPNIADTYDIGD